MDNENFTLDFEEVTNVGGGTSDFNELENRPSYDGQTMTGETDIPAVPTKTSELTNDSGYQTAENVASTVAAETSARETADASLQTQINAKQNTLTAGDNITIEGDVISATGGGGGTIELTTADYNYPADNPDGVAVWLLPNGYYKGGTAKIYWNTSWSGNYPYEFLVTDARTGQGNMRGILKLYGYNSGGNGTFFSPNWFTISSAGAASMTNGGRGADDVNGYILRAMNVVSGLTSTETKQPLAAYQGKVLNDKITALEARVAALEGN